MEHKISRFPVPTLDEMPDDIRTKIEQITEQYGFTPNVFPALAHRPAELRAFMAYYEELITPAENGPTLSLAERELIILATSITNDCMYCVTTHAAALRVASGEPLVADRVIVNYKEAGLTERERHILDLALKVAGDSASVSEADLEAMRERGFTDDEIWDIGAITAFFALSNRLCSFAGFRPNDEFFTMGR